jgi:hypothetical protein
MNEKNEIYNKESLLIIIPKIGIIVNVIIMVILLSFIAAMAIINYLK